MVPIDFKTAITQDIAEIDLALSVLNNLREVNMARLALIHEAEKRSAEDSGTHSKGGAERDVLRYLFFGERPHPSGTGTGDYPLETSLDGPTPCKLR